MEFALLNGMILVKGIGKTNLTERHGYLVELARVLRY
jgi:hypothetical protein